MSTGSTFEDLIAESPLVKLEMARLRDLHGVYDKALQLASEQAGEPPDAFLARAAALVGGVAPVRVES